MDKNDVRKKYTNGKITIVWQSAKCIHSGQCVRTNPAVFQPKEHPWIKPDGSDTESIIKTVEGCPSGALTYYYNESQPR